MRKRLFQAAQAAIVGTLKIQLNGILFLSLLCFLFITAPANAQEAYAVYDDGTLTFYYDDSKDSRGGTIYDINLDSDYFGWGEHKQDITHVVFNRSFSQARPISTGEWFYNMYNLETIDGLGYLNTSEVVDMSWMFWNCKSLTSLDVSNFDTSNVENMAGMFGLYQMESILTSLDVSGFDTRNVKNMYAMFQNCSKLTSLDVSNFNTSNVEDMNWMFYNCNSLTSLDVSNFNTSKVTRMQEMFCCCENLTSLDVSNFNTSNVTTMKWMFENCHNLMSLDVTGFNTSKVTNMEGMFEYCQNLTSLDVTGFNTSNVTTMAWLFYGCSNLTNLDVTGFNTSNVTTMEGLFGGCSNLTNLVVSSFNTSKVTNMNSMFSTCSNLTSLDVSAFNTSNCTSMEYMFGFMNKIKTLDLSHFVTSNVKDMQGMFLYCFDLTLLNVSSFDTSNVTNMEGMFTSCQSLSQLDISNFNTSKVTNMSRMFYGCISLTHIDLGHFDTSKVTTMKWMFSNCGIEFLDLTNFDTSSLLDVSYMFYNNNSLSTIYVGELWNLDKVTTSECIFDICRSLVGGMGTQFEDDHSDISYAHIDEGPSNPGYLSTYSNCDFPDLQKTNDFYGATCYLYRMGVISGSDINGKMDAEEPLRRSHLAKIAFRGLYSIKGRTVPSSIISDNFPSVYEDLAERTSTNDYYYQAAKALLYLEYGDGITPFDRNRLMFEPEENISRVDVLKVLLETFNIKPDLEGTNNPFPEDENVVKIASNNPLKMGYIRKAAALGIIATNKSEFRPYANCLRGEAFVMLTRILRKVVSYGIQDPNPQENDYFHPLNTTLKTISLGLGLQLGNFQHYTKTSFAMSGVVPLTFSHSYNSYNTTLPSVFYGDKSSDETDSSYKPLGDGWSHTYHSFLTVVGDITKGNARLIAHWGGGSIDVYKSNGSELIPESMGVYDKCQLEGSEVVITTKQQLKYHFGAQSGSDANVLYFLKSADIFSSV
ncbi:MAG: BspA family leucine-rich repeat surface protein [Prevotella sp.]|nr:BspA family leucine-rich repeat surface protein [Prevotella sp.]